MFWVCWISHRGTRPSAKAWRDWRSVTLAAGRMVTKNWRANRHRLRPLRCPQTPKEESELLLEMAISFCHLGIFFHHLNVERDVCQRANLLLFLFSFCSDLYFERSCRFDSLILQHPQHCLLKKRIKTMYCCIVTNVIAFCEGMRMFRMWRPCLLMGDSWRGKKITLTEGSSLQKCFLDKGDSMCLRAPMYCTERLLTERWNGRRVIKTAHCIRVSWPKFDWIYHVVIIV